MCPDNLVLTTGISNPEIDELRIINTISGKMKDIFSAQFEELSGQLVDFKKSIDGSLQKLEDRINKKFKDIESDNLEFQNSMENSLQKLEDKINKKFKDIESDQRTTQAIGRLVQDAGLSFKGTKIPYPLQGNAAIEDIKDYY